MLVEPAEVADDAAGRLEIFTVEPSVRRRAVPPGRAPGTGRVGTRVLSFLEGRPALAALGLVLTLVLVVGLMLLR